MAVALRRSRLLVQHFESLCTFGDTAVKQNYRAMLIRLSRPNGFGGTLDLLPGMTIQMKFMKK